MTKLTSKERITRILKHQPVDRVGLYEDFWPETRVKWQNEGHLQKDELLEDHFNFDKGPLSVEWEDCGMERERGVKEFLEFVGKINFKPWQIAFEASFSE